MFFNNPIAVLSKLHPVAQTAKDTGLIASKTSLFRVGFSTFLFLGHALRAQRHGFLPSNLESLMDASREAMKVHWAAFCRYLSLTDCSPRSSFGRCNQQCCLEEAGSQAACSLLLQEPVWRCSTSDQRREAAESWYWGKKEIIFQTNQLPRTAPCMTARRFVPACVRNSGSLGTSTRHGRNSFFQW